MKIVLDLSVDELKDLLRLSNKGDKFVKCSKRQIIKLRQNKEFVITYTIDYGFCGGYDADIEIKVEIYRDEDEAYRRYYELQRKSDIYDVRLEGRC